MAPLKKLKRKLKKAPLWEHKALRKELIEEFRKHGVKVEENSLLKYSKEELHSIKNLLRETREKHGVKVKDVVDEIKKLARDKPATEVLPKVLNKHVERLAKERVREILEPVSKGAELKEIEYKGKKIKLTEEELVRFLREHGLKHAEELREHVHKEVVRKAAQEILRIAPEVAELKEIEYKGKKIKLTEEELVRFLREHGLERAEEIKEHVYKEARVRRGARKVVEFASKIAELKEIKYKGKKIPLREEDLVRFLREHGLEHTIKLKELAANAVKQKLAELGKNTTLKHIELAKRLGIKSIRTAFEEIPLEKLEAAIKKGEKASWLYRIDEYLEKALRDELRKKEHRELVELAKSMGVKTEELSQHTKENLEKAIMVGLKREEALKLVELAKKLGITSIGEFANGVLLKHLEEDLRTGNFSRWNRRIKALLRKAIEKKLLRITYS